VVRNAGMIKPNIPPPKKAKTPLNKAKAKYPKFLYILFLISTAKAIAVHNTMLKSAPILAPLRKPSEKLEPLPNRAAAIPHKTTQKRK
jgi:hypothetical protein